MVLKAALVTNPFGLVKNCHARHVVVFDDDGPLIMKKCTSQVNRLRKADENYFLDAQVFLQAFNPVRHKAFTGSRDEQDRCKFRMQTQQGRTLGEEGIEEQGGVRHSCKFSNKLNVKGLWSSPHGLAFDPRTNEHIVVNGEG